METNPRKFGYYSTNLVDFTAKNLEELVNTLLNPRKAEKFLSTYKFSTKKQIAKQENGRKEFASFLKHQSIDGYIRQLFKTKTFLNEFGRQKLEEFLLDSDRLDLRMRKDVSSSDMATFDQHRREHKSNARLL